MLGELVAFLNSQLTVIALQSDEMELFALEGKFMVWFCGEAAKLSM